MTGSGWLMTMMVDRSISLAVSLMKAYYDWHWPITKNEDTPRPSSGLSMGCTLKMAGPDGYEMLIGYLNGRMASWNKNLQCIAVTNDSLHGGHRHILPLNVQ